MKILFFTGSYGHASKILGKNPVGEPWVNSLLASLHKNQSIEIGVACYYGYEKLDKRSQGGIDYYFIPNLNGRIRRFVERFNHTDQRKGDLKFFNEIIIDFKPSVIHIFGTEKGFGLIAKTTKIPVIIQLQGVINSINAIVGNLPVKPSNLFRYDSLKQLMTGKGLYHSTILLKKKAERELELFRINRNFIGRTDYDRRLTKILSPGSGYYHVEEMIREDFFMHSWNNTLNSKAILHTTILGATYKGLENIILTATLLRKAGIDFEWRISGVSSESEISVLWSRFLNLRLKSLPIVFLGATKTTDLINRMLESNIYIHPSHIENSSNSICEAMVLGLPVIATYAGGTPSLLTDKHEGVLVQNGDPFHLAGAIIEMLGNYDNARTMGINARERAIKRHNPEQIINKLIATYNLLTEK